MPDSEFISIQEVADLLKIDYSTARRWVRDGKLPGKKVANRTFALREEIEGIAEQFQGTVSINEAAELINRAPRTVYWLLTEEKKIDGFTWMRRWFIYENSIDEYLALRGPDKRLEPKGYQGVKRKS